MIEQRSPDEDRYAHLRANATSQKQRTVDRLSRAIATLEAEGRPVNTFTIKEVSGLDYMAYYRNAEALALFRTHSTHLRKEREKERPKSMKCGWALRPSQDYLQPLRPSRSLSYLNLKLTVNLSTSLKTANSS